MKFTATVLAPLAVFFCLGGCQNAKRSKTPPGPTPVTLASDALLPSPRLIVGRIIAVDLRQGTAVVEVSGDAPPAAVADGTELIGRTLALQETARLRASRFLRGRTLGTKIVAGQPSPGDEVVWLPP